MAAIIHQKDKRSGLTYAYESISYWDKEKKQSRAKRKLIGRVDETTGEIIPTRPRRPKPTPLSHEERLVEMETIAATKRFYGASYLFDEIGRETGVIADLKTCFPDRYKKILSIAYYLILEDKNPLSRFPKWSKTHKHPFQKDITSQRSSELFASINEEERMHFFRLQARRRAENEYWAYDTTSISSYSKVLKQVRYGINKEHDLLPQLNLAMVFGEKSNLPFYYKKLPGNIADVKTIKNLLNDLDFLSCKKVKLVLDRGFYSEENINNLYKNHLKFLIATKLSLKFVKNSLDEHRESIRNFDCYNEEYELFSKTIPYDWNYSQKRPYKNDILKEKRRMYIHIYYNTLRAADDETNFNKMLSSLQREIESGKQIADHEGKYNKYFEIKTTQKGGLKAIAKQSAIDEAKKNYGFFVLISNEIKDSTEALPVYRNKDLIEKGFGDLKERLDFRRVNVSSDLSLEGKLFVEFIALIFLSYAKKQMQDHSLFKKYTMQELLDELDIIECFERKGNKLTVGEVTKKQFALYEAMGVKQPTSLC